MAVAPLFMPIPTYSMIVPDVCIFVPMRLFGEKAAWVHQAHDIEQLNLFYMMIVLPHHEE